MKWDGSVVLISGASRGIGAELAAQAAGKGARVGLLARTSSDLDALQTSLGSRCAVATADVSSSADVSRAVSEISAALGPVDILVNNAGIGHYGAFLDLDVAEAERMMRTNYFGVMHLLKSVLPTMVDRRKGHLVTVASISGRIGSPFEAAYSATKFAVIGMTEALSVELSPFGIRTSIVNPGPVDTPFFDARGHAYERKRPRPVSAARVAEAIISAVEANSAEVYVPASLRQAVVAKTLIPPLFRIGTARAFAREIAEERKRTRK